MKSLKFVTKFAPVLACAGILLAGSGVSFGQIPGAGKGGMAAGFTKFFGDTTNFVSKAEVRVFDKNKKETTSMAMGFDMLGGLRMRMDINLAAVKSQQMSPEFAAGLRQLGMDQMTTILLEDKNTIISIYPGLKAYAESPMPKDEIAAKAITYKVTKTRLGKETIDGHLCEKESVTLTDDKGMKQHAIVWSATDLKGFPVQIQITEDDSTLMMRFKDVKLGRPYESSFQPTPGFSKFDSVDALMSSAITHKMSNGSRHQ
jgi:hypothetical protein